MHYIQCLNHIHSMFLCRNCIHINVSALLYNAIPFVEHTLQHLSYYISLSNIHYSPLILFIPTPSQHALYHTDSILNPFTLQFTQYSPQSITFFFLAYAIQHSIFNFFLCSIHCTALIQLTLFTAGDENKNRQPLIVFKKNISHHLCHN